MKEARVPTRVVIQEPGLKSMAKTDTTSSRKYSSSSPSVRDTELFSIVFFFAGDATDIRYLVMTNCDLQMVGDEFSRKPYAIAVQQGSPLKDQFNNA